MEYGVYNSWNVGASGDPSYTNFVLYIFAITIWSAVMHSPIKMARNRIGALHRSFADTFLRTRTLQICLMKILEKVEMKVCVIIMEFLGKV